MKTLRTPDSRFENLPDYPFEPNYVMLDDYDGGQVRMHYVDAGNPDGQPILLMHGEPTWSFLYRKMIPVLAAAGHRVIAPDLIGFGRSDKPTERADYTYDRHVGWVLQLVEQLSLENVTLFGQDWGGFIGLRLAAENEPRFARIAIGNTGLVTGEENIFGEEFDQWLAYSQNDPEFEIGDVVAFLGAMPELKAEIKAGYSAPFPDESYKTGARQFPLLVPITPDNPAKESSIAAWKVLEKWQKPFLTAFSDGDYSVDIGVHLDFQKRVPGAKGQAHTVIQGAGHFLQEQEGEALAGTINQFMASNPL